MVIASWTSLDWGSFGDSLMVTSEPCLFYSIQAIPCSRPTQQTPPCLPNFDLPLPTVLPMNQSINCQPLVGLPTKDIGAPWVSVHFVSMVAWERTSCLSQPGPQAHACRSSWIGREHLVLSAGGLGELEGDTAAGQLAVDLGVGVQAVVNTTTLLLVEDDLEGLGTVLLGAKTLADDLDGVDEVGQDGVVDGGQCAGAGTLLLLGVARAGGSLGAGQDAARGQDQHVAVGELLLQLTGQAVRSWMSVTSNASACG